MAVSILSRRVSDHVDSRQRLQEKIKDFTTGFIEDCRVHEIENALWTIRTYFNEVFKITLHEVSRS